jgi:hypothetical protein
VDIKSCSCDFRVHIKRVPFGTGPPGHSAAQNLAKLVEGAKSVKLAAKGSVPANFGTNMRKSGRTKEGHLRA